MMRTSDTDTIVATATAQGEGAIGIVRLSGPKAIEFADKCFVGRNCLTDVVPRTLTFGRFISSGQDLDEVLASVMYAPNSYTGENTVEFNCHGGPFLLRRIVDIFVSLGEYVNTFLFYPPNYINSQTHHAQHINHCLRSGVVA